MILKWILFTESVTARLGLNVSVVIWSVTNLSQLPVHVEQLQELKFESSIKRGSRESGMGKHRHNPAHFCYEVHVENNQWRICATTGILKASRHATCSQLSSAVPFQCLQVKMLTRRRGGMSSGPEELATTVLRVNVCTGRIVMACRWAIIPAFQTQSKKSQLLSNCVHVFLANVVFTVFFSFFCEFS